jgi:hypothetical protein
MKKIKIILSILFLSIILFSCDDKFEQINTNPNDPIAVPASLLLPGVVRSMGNNVYTVQYGTDMGSCWSQHMAKVQYNSEARYFPRSGNISNIWNGIYSGFDGGGTNGILKNAKRMYVLAEAEGNNNLMAISLVTQSYAFLLATDLYGDIPFSEALSGDITGNLTPKYNTQKEVYEGVFKMLDNAATLFGSGVVNATDDILYQGDVSKWAKFGASLKFRAVMRSSKKYTTAEVSAMLTPLVNKVFASKNEEAKLIYLNAPPSANPMFETISTAEGGGNRDEYRLCSTLTDIMNGLSDPRLPAFAEKNSDGDYKGKPAGYLQIPNQFSGDLVSKIGDAVYLKADAPGYFVSNTQIQFLLAEAAHKGYITGNAADYYKAAITSSFLDNGISTSGVDAYVNTNLYSNTAEGLKRLHLQEWIALYGQGFESWTEWRRNGVPALTPAIDGQYNEVPSRLNYPNSEQSINGVNYAAAVANQGADLLTTKLWWMN